MVLYQGLFRVDEERAIAGLQQQVAHLLQLGLLSEVEVVGFVELGERFLVPAIDLLV